MHSMLESVLSGDDVELVRSTREPFLRERGARLASLKGENPSELDEETRLLVASLFARALPAGKAFGDISDREAALLDRHVLALRAAGRWDSLHEHELRKFYAALYFNSVCGETRITPTQFHAAAGVVLDDMFKRVMNPQNGIIKNPEKAYIAVIWRAACVGIEAAHKAGFRRAIHIAMSRDHATAKSQVYFRGESASQSLPADAEVFGFDPMFATGGSMIDLVEHLKTMGVDPTRINLGAVFAVPEGLARVMDRYPDLHSITVGRVENGLDGNAYIKGMRVGDFGDQVAGAFTDERVNGWNQMGMMTELECARFLQRMRTGR